MPHPFHTVDSHRASSEHTLELSTRTLNHDGTIDDDRHEEIGSSIHQTQLRQDLEERHVGMIAFSVTVGVGLFLSAGKVVFLTGPGLAVFIYILVGLTLWSVNACLGEMTALFPVKGPIFEFPSRFIDEAVGFAAGWMVWFNFVVVVAVEINAVAQLFNFRFDPDYLAEVQYPTQQLGWSFGQHTNPAVWVFMFLIFILLVNLLPVRVFGELEYVFGCSKIVFITGLIFFNIVITSMRGNTFEYYDEPYSFESQNFTSGTHVITGGPGHLASVWSAMTTAIFSLTGFETVAISAAENRDLAREESVKIATRKWSLRVMLLYSLAIFTVGLNVPYTDINLKDLSINSIKSGEHSVFVIAAVRAGLRGWPEVLNAFFIFSATSCGLSSLYIASRTLHALACIPDVWPSWTISKNVRLMLERTLSGVPMAAVFTSWLFGLLAFLVVSPNPTVTIGRIATNATVSLLLVYTVVCASYLRFYKHIERASRDDTTPGIDPQRHRKEAYNREDYTLYPYKSHLQRFRAWYGLVTCSLLVLFNGWRSLMPPMSVDDFIPSYINIILFLLLVALYHLKVEESKNPLNWRFRPSMNIREPISVAEPDRSRRRGHLKLDSKGGYFTRENGRRLGEWLVTWLK